MAPESRAELSSASTGPVDREETLFTA